MARLGDGSTVLVSDVDRSWEREVLGAHRVVVVPPTEIRDRRDWEGVAALVVNVAAPGSTALLRGRLAIGVPTWACVSEPGSGQMVTLRRVAVVSALRPIDPVAMLVRRQARRRVRMRVVAAGRETRTMLALRHALALDGVGVSLAWDAHQLRDVCELVHPQLVVVDLALARGAHDAVLALGLRRHVPDFVFASEADEARAFATAFARVLRRERLPGRHEGLGSLIARGAPAMLPLQRAHG